ATFPKRIDWPTGSIELKASWRELTAREAADPATAKRYYVTEALLYNDPGAPDEWKKIGRFETGPCKLAKVALVGLHIVYKIASNPLFVWATFEHVDNLVPPPGSRTASFFDPACPADCIAPPTGEVLKPGDRCFDCVPVCRDNFQYCPAATKTQVVRRVPIPAAVRAINAAVRGRLGDSVWSHYQLVGVQHPESLSTFDPARGERLLGNTTMETFNQTYSSCVGCHAFARTSNPTNSANFSWFLRRARKPAGFDPTLQQALAHHVPGGGEVPPDLRPTPQEVFARVAGYESWGTWPADVWNDFTPGLRRPDGTKGPALPGQNPHGAFIRIFVNDIALSAVGQKRFPAGSVVLKENLPCAIAQPGSAGLAERCAKAGAVGPAFQSPVELTLMVKMEPGFYPEGGDWYYLKGRPAGPTSPQIVDFAGRVEACASCHAPHDSGSFMFTYAFGQRPEIRGRCQNPLGPGRIPGCSLGPTIGR
ncbi:MAG TPA: cytochrome P460 family protein, partial [Thermoanaerobaculia bacterium]|nr:cytochrome P460 family protein [Thermoanaerobaculia bacterium]